MRTAPIVLAAALAIVSGICSAENGTNSLSPKEYSALHLLASDPKDPKWAESVRQLATGGDGFTLEHLKTLEAQKLDARQPEILKETRLAISQRNAKEDAKTFTKLIQIRLERAAWADLGCNQLEGTLVPWTLKVVRQHLDTPGVVAELKRIQSDYLPAVEQKTLYSSMQERVRQYARQLLGR